MPSLRILNLTGNRDLIRLPRTLATCDNLYDLLIDSENFVWPAVKILQSTTTVILQYLTTGEFNVSEDDFGRKSNNRYEMLNNHGSRKEEEKIAKREVDMDYDNDDMLLAFKRQQEQKQQLLEAVLRQQCEADKTVSKMQQLKDDERNKLIKDILKAEDTANIVINKFLALKTIEDTSLKDKERMEEERLLEKLNLDHSDLRKQEILKLISQSIVDEEKKIKNYNRTRNQNAIQILQTDDQMSTNLNKVYLNYQDNKTKAIVQICEDENLQKRAVSELIAINDSRSWGLVEQMKIVEAELAEMTTVELQRKRKLSDDQLNDFADKRMQLTGILMSLLDQQELRKKELLDTLCAMESQRTLDQEDFWLLQYQRLLDSRPLEFSPKMASIDPVLGYHFLCNGVIHCLPFLQKLFQNMKLLIEDINEDDLKEAGIKSENDRLNILKSIKEFVNSRLEKPSAPLREVEKAEEAVEIERDNTVTGSLLSECVVCMEENVSTIFIPCGHLCCCENCQGNMEICPICRGEIEKRVKIIQP
ncbi:LRSAM1 family protein [Megaselia abdita]